MFNSEEKLLLCVLSKGCEMSNSMAVRHWTKNSLRKPAAYVIFQLKAYVTEIFFQSHLHLTFHFNIWKLDYQSSLKSIWLN